MAKKEQTDGWLGICDNGWIDGWMWCKVVFRILGCHQNSEYLKRHFFFFAKQSVQKRKYYPETSSLGRLACSSESEREKERE